VIVNWIYLAKDEVQQRIPANTLMHFRIL